MALLADMLGELSEHRAESSQEWEAIRNNIESILIVIDDDPTGTQAIADLPVLMRWEEDDLQWAFHQGKAAVYVTANSRALHPAEAAERNKEIAMAALNVASREGLSLAFASRSDSTLRGHFPLEPEVISETLATITGRSPNAIILIPAFPDAGRITLHQMHYAGSFHTGEFTPVGETEFAADSTFGYGNSHLASWVEEKSLGQIEAKSVIALDITTIRQGADSVYTHLADAPRGSMIVVDCVSELDLRVVATALDRAERAGMSYVYRVGPPFVRARIGQDVTPALTSLDISALFSSASRDFARGGLILVGSHTAVTTSQLKALQEGGALVSLEIPVELVLDETSRTRVIDDLVRQLSAGLTEGSVILSTSRTRVVGSNETESLKIARTISDSMSRIVRGVVAQITPRFVLAKGGITSADVAQFGLGITRAMARGSLLPGLVSLWEPLEGPATGIPYVVFPGNVGTSTALKEVVKKLEGATL